jgi:Flp pilus assembly protein TadB
MSPVTLIVIAFLVALPVMAGAFAGGAVIVAIPVAVIGIALLGFFDFRRRRSERESLKSFREDAATESVDFTERDKETLASSD